VAAHVEVREALGTLGGEVPLVWDPHPRGPVPLPGADVVTPNEAESARFAAGVQAGDTAACAARGEALRRRWQAGAVCVTRAAHGALLVRDGVSPLVLPATPARNGDPCGAGDCFAARLVVELSEGTPLENAARQAVTAASAFVAAGGARRALDRFGGSAPGEQDALAVVERTRALGGTVVATGGCFDLLHAGHIHTLQAARRLGDCLIVLLNSDASVRRLKGPHRPLVPECDRASVAGALGCVDAVMVFDEDTPERALRALRPHVWAKGGDYEGVAMPEEDALAEWGGRAVLLPYVDGHSTTRLIEEAATRA
jgi:rfaE bifunctional protein nucleotidyltransferase chain/domain